MFILLRSPPLQRLSFNVAKQTEAVPGPEAPPEEARASNNRRNTKSCWAWCCCWRKRPRSSSNRRESEEEILLSDVNLNRSPRSNDSRHLKVPLSERQLHHQQSSSYASSSILNLPPSTSSTPRHSLQNLPDRFNRFRQKSISEISVVLDIIRSGSALESTDKSPVPVRSNRASASTGNLSKRKSKRMKKPGHFDTLRPNYIQQQLRYGKVIDFS